MADNINVRDMTFVNRIVWMRTRSYRLWCVAAIGSIKFQLDRFGEMC